MGLAITAPGGDLDADDNDDGYPDGILAESIHPQDPTRTGFWFMQGTSQASAVTAGAAVQLLEAGATPDEVRRALTAGADDDLGRWPFADGYGGGHLDLATGLSEWDSAPPEVFDGHSYFLGLLPWVEDLGNGQGRVRVRFSVVDETGAAASGLDVIAQVQGPGGRTVTCTTDGTGTCDAWGDSTALADGGGPLALVWTVEAGTLQRGGLGLRPAGVLFGSDALEVLVAALAADPTTADRALGLVYEAGTDPDLGAVAEAYAVVDSGSGLVGSPIGVVFTPPSLPQGAPSPGDLDLDGSGLVGSPIGLLPITLIDFGGSGLVGSPIGVLDIPLVMINGSGLVGSPIGISGVGIYTLGGSGLVGSPIGLLPPGDPMPPPGPPPTGYEGSNTQALFQAGGFLTPDGLAGASALSITTLAGYCGSGSVDLAATGAPEAVAYAE